MVRTQTGRPGHHELVPYLLAGAVIGLVGVGAFGLLHAVIIVPIWTRLPGGMPFALLAGIAMGWSLREFRIAPHPRVRNFGGLGFGVLLWATLLPATLLGIVLRGSGMHGSDDTWEVLAECLLSVIAGLAAGRWIGGRWRAGVAMGCASVALTLAQAGPLPVMESIRAAGLFAGLACVYAASGAMLGVLASRLARRMGFSV